MSVGDLEGCIHYKVVKYEKIKFLVIALKDSIEIYAWAPKPYHKFMAFKVRKESINKNDREYPRFRLLAAIFAGVLLFS